jgi:hypothetical protein
MGGGLMQLVAYGAQDIYLTGNPQITFFKVVYRRHTNFSMETIQQTISGSDKTDGGTGTVTISRNGDLVYKVYVTSETINITDGDEIINEVELEIGGQRIDKHYKEWNQVWNELTTVESKALGLKTMKGCIGSSGDSVSPGMIQIPLNFWFCRNPGLALPLIALQYHEVKLKLNWGVKASAGPDYAVCKVMCDYIYLDTDERRRFAQVSHEYLIEQIQKQTASASTTSKLNFNHPVKELIWVTPISNEYLTARIKLNGHDRFSDQPEEYFQLRQPYDYHTAIPTQNLPQGEIALGADILRSAKSPLPSLVPTVTVTTGKCSVSVMNGSICTTADTPTSTVYGFFDTDLATVFVVGKLYTISASFNTGADKVETTTLVRCTGVAGAAVSTTFDDTVAAALTLETTGGSASGTYTPGSHTIGATFNRLIYNHHKAAAVNATAATQVTINSIISSSSTGCRTSNMFKKINVYSFALKPEEHQPSGTCNFSRIDNAQLVTGAALGTTDNIYAVNYNVLRIMSGMGGLAYSN